jgi:uncharacterized OB-fold protein
MEQLTGTLTGAACTCGKTFLPPRDRCIFCSGPTYPIEFKGTGTILTYTVLNVVPEGFEAPLILGLIQLDGIGDRSESGSHDQKAGDVEDSDRQPPMIVCEGKLSEEEEEVTENVTEEVIEDVKEVRIGLKVIVEKRGEKFFFKGSGNP